MLDPSADQKILNVDIGNMPDFRISPALTPPRSDSSEKRGSLPNILLYSPLGTSSSGAESSKAARERERERDIVAGLMGEFLVDDRETSVDVWKRFERDQRQKRIDAGEVVVEEELEGEEENQVLKGISKVICEEVKDDRETSLDVWKRFEAERMRNQEMKHGLGLDIGSEKTLSEGTRPEGWCGRPKRKESPVDDSTSPTKVGRWERQTSAERIVLEDEIEA